jgi:hypothetical protein
MQLKEFAYLLLRTKRSSRATRPHAFTPQLFKTTSLALVLLKSCAKAWQDAGKPSHSAAEQLLNKKVTSQQRLGFFILKNPSHAQVLLRRRRNHTPAQ